MQGPARQVSGLKVLTVKLNHLSSSPRTCRMREQTLFSDLHRYCFMGTCEHAHAKEQTCPY